MRGLCYIGILSKIRRKFKYFHNYFSRKILLEISFKKPMNDEIVIFVGNCFLFLIDVFFCFPCSVSFFKEIFHLDTMASICVAFCRCRIQFIPHGQQRAQRDYSDRSLVELRQYDFADYAVRALDIENKNQVGTIFFNTQFIMKVMLCHRKYLLFHSKAKMNINVAEHLQLPMKFKVLLVLTIYG